MIVIPGDTIAIGDDISIQVVAVRGEEVRLGIERPRNVPVKQEQVGLGITVDGAKPSP